MACKVGPPPWVGSHHGLVATVVWGSPWALGSPLGPPLSAGIALVGHCRGPGPSGGPAGIGPCRGPYKYVKTYIFNV